MANNKDSVVLFDPMNEMVVLGAALVDPEIRKRLVRELTSDQFLAPEHRVVWRGLQELERQHLDYDPATLLTVEPEADVPLLGLIQTSRPDVPPNLEHHVQILKWDHLRSVAATGPVAKLVEALQDARRPPDDVRAIAQSVGRAFDGYADSKYICDTDELVESQMREIRGRAGGKAITRYGIDAVDFYEDDFSGTDGKGRSMANRPRLVPAAAPGLVTCITGVSGSGKTTVTARACIGLARQRLRVLYGAWEVQPGMNLELMAGMTLDYSRTDMTEGLLNEEQLQALEKRMRQIGKYVVFLKNPFNRRDRRGSKNDANDRNLDLIEQHIELTGADVFIADLWKRCLRNTDPDEEEHALTRQQDMCARTKCHGILLQQQRLKDIEMRPDKRPTREGIKGSGAWTEVPDTILGIHRPALWKEIPDTYIEICVLKQRWGPWPLAVEVQWNADRGWLGTGRSISYKASVEDAGQANEANGDLMASVKSNKAKFQKPDGYGQKKSR